jgi:hypothetical protein
MVGGPIPSSAQTSHEVVIARDYLTLETKVLGPLTGRVYFTGKARVTSDFDGNTTLFGYVDYAFNLAHGLSATMEVQWGSGMELTPRVGPEHLAVGERGFWFNLVHTEIADPGENWEHVMLAELREVGPFTLQFETALNYGPDEFNFGVERFRIGVPTSEGRYLAGLAADLSQVRTSLGGPVDHDARVGVFLRTYFR